MIVIPMTCILLKTKPAYVLESKSKLNHLLPTGDLKLYARSQNEVKLLIHAVRIFYNDIGMVCGVGKNATIKMNRSKLDEMERGTLVEGAEYKYLGIFKVEDCA